AKRFLRRREAGARFRAGRGGGVWRQFTAGGGSAPELLRAFQGGFQDPRRKAVRVMWERAVARGELRADIDAGTVIDLLFGPIVYRLMTEHGPLNDAAAEMLVEAAFSGITVKK